MGVNTSERSAQRLGRAVMVRENCGMDSVRGETTFMARAIDIVQGFMGAMGKGDFVAARKHLDDHLSFQGPIETFQKADPYVESLTKLHHIIERIEMKKMFVDGDDVCLLYDMVTNTPAGTAFIAEWHHAKGDKISAIRVRFSPRPVPPLFP